MVANQIQDADRVARWVPLCSWHGKGCSNREENAKSVDQVSDSCDSYDLTISIKKTEVVYQPAPEKPYKEPAIDNEVNARIAKASAVFGIEVESDLTQSWQSTDLWCCQHYYTHALYRLVLSIATKL